jgi:hypothetical protein
MRITSQLSMEPADGMIAAYFLTLRHALVGGLQR